MSARRRRSLVSALPTLLIACVPSPPPGAPVTPAASSSAATPTNASASSTPEAGTAPTNARAITVLVTSDPKTTYCDGARMDSAGYGKTLTVEKPLTLPPEGSSDTDVVRAVVGAVTSGMCNTVMSQLTYTIEHGTVHIPSFGAWAGASIAMCTCKPEVEVNLVRIPGVTRVVWDAD